MDRTKIVAIGLMAAGVLGLAYGGITYTEDTHEASIGLLSLSVDDKRRVNVPVWAGVGMLLVGGLMFATGLRRADSDSMKVCQLSMAEGVRGSHRNADAKL